MFHRLSNWSLGCFEALEPVKEQGQIAVPGGREKGQIAPVVAPLSKPARGS